MTEVTDEQDPLLNSDKMHAAIYNEICDRVRTGTFKTMLRTQLSTNTSVIRSRVLLDFKSNAEGQINYKTIYVLVGHHHDLKHFCVHGT